MITFKKVIIFFAVINSVCSQFCKRDPWGRGIVCEHDCKKTSKNKVPEIDDESGAEIFLYRIDNCPTVELPVNIYDRVKSVVLQNIKKVKVSQNEIQAAESKSSDLWFDMRRSEIDGFNNVLENRQIDSFVLLHNEIKSEGQVFENIQISSRGYVKIKGNTFGNGNLPWKFHSSLTAILQENPGDIKFSNNNLTYACEDIQNDLKEFIKDNQGFLEETVSGLFVKSLKCQQDGQMVDLWTAELTLSSATEKVTGDFATKLLMMILVLFFI